MNTPTTVVALALLAACATPHRESPQDPPATVNPRPGSQAAPSQARGLEPLPDSYAHTGHREITTPVSQPFLFESPVNDTSIRPIFMHHAFPNRAPLAGGDLNWYALQIRVAATDRLGIIATKSGYVDLRPGAANDETGWSDLAAGIKYVLIDNPRQRAIVTAGVTYEFANGDSEVFQGNGDGLLRPLLTGAQEYGFTNLMAAVGYSQPIDGDAEASSLDYHAQVDWEVNDRIAPFFAFHGVTYTSDGSATPANFEGLDLINFGATSVDGQSVFVGSAGARFRVTEDIALGASYDFPIGGRQDILDWRVTADAIFYF